MVWGALWLVTIQANITGNQYIDNILQPIAIPYFDIYTLA